MRILPLVLVLSTASYAHAQNKADPANPISSTMKGTYERVKKFLIASADLVPPADYAFKPTPEVRSFGQLIGHVADAQYMFCSAAKKEAHPKKESIEKTATTKDALKKALADAFAYCDAVYAASTDAALTTPVDLFGGKMTKFAALDINTAHNNEHYGNIVTYLRLKKLTPPSSAEK
jgi:uncharacterized damage-inducible protein DinB